MGASNRYVRQDSLRAYARMRPKGAETVPGTEECEAVKLNNRKGRRARRKISEAAYAEIERTFPND